jgi:hypothetical protein
LPYITNYHFRGAEGWFLSLVEAAEGGGRTAADNAVLSAPAAGEHGSDRIAEPAMKRGIAGEVAVSDYRADNVTIVPMHYVSEV